MIFTKRIFALLAALAIIGSLTGCNQPGSTVSLSGSEPDRVIDIGDEGAESPDVTTNADTDTTTASAEDTTTAPAGGSTSAKKTTAATKAPVIQTQKPTTTTKKPAANAATGTTKPPVEDIVVSGDDVKIEDTPEVGNKVEVVTAHTPLAASQYYQYSTLNAVDKTLYGRLEKAVEKTENAVDVKDLKVSYDEAYTVMQRFIADHPHYFWLSRSFSIIYRESKDSILTVRLHYTDGTKQDDFDKGGNITELADRQVIAKQMDALNKKIKEILSTISAGATAVEKEKAIHDYILDNVIYDNKSAGLASKPTDAIPHAYDIYGAVCEGKAVCEGYSKMFQYLCYCVGINATQIMGESKGVGHMWNAVLIDGSWYQVDVTWDDGADVPYYGYFNITTNQLKKDHIIDDTHLSVPTCSKDSAAYYKYYTMRITSNKKAPENLEKVADQLAKSKEKYLIVHVENGKMPSNEYLLTHLLGNDSTLGKYIRKKGYAFSLGNNIRIYDNGEYLYFPVNRGKK